MQKNDSQQLAKVPAKLVQTQLLVTSNPKFILTFLTFPRFFNCTIRTGNQLHTLVTTFVQLLLLSF